MSPRVRYLRLYASFLRFSFSKALQFRLDFFFRVFMDVVFYAVNLGFFGILFAHTRALGGWTWDQVLVFAGGVFVSDALHMTIFSNNMWWFPIYVNRGDLDYHLVRPVSALFMLSLRDFAANSFLNLLLAFAVLAVVVARYPGPLPLPSVVLYVGLLLVGVILRYALQMTLLIPVFWLHTVHGLREIYFSLDQLADRPDGIFTGFVGRLLTSILPFAVIVSFPTRALFQGFSWPLVLHVVGVTVAALLAMGALWRLGLRAYASASS